VVVANGRDYPDALAAGPYASAPFGTNIDPTTGANTPAAVLLSDNGTLDRATAAYIASRFAGSGATASATRVVAVGGPAVAALATLKGSAGHYLGVVGVDRIDTAGKVADLFPLTTSTAGLATGFAFPDALTGGGYIARTGGPLLLTDPTALSDHAAAWLSARRTSLMVADVFGGEGAIGAPVIPEVQKATGLTSYTAF
jgi:hypothetical protein